MSCSTVSIAGYDIGRVFYVMKYHRVYLPHLASGDYDSQNSRMKAGKKPERSQALLEWSYLFG